MGGEGGEEEKGKEKGGGVHCQCTSKQVIK